MEELVALCKRRGFIFQSNEIYGGLQGLYDYGPLGVELKNNLKQAWWRSMVFDRDLCVFLLLDHDFDSNVQIKVLADRNGSVRLVRSFLPSNGRQQYRIMHQLRKV